MNTLTVCYVEDKALAYLLGKNVYRGEIEAMIQNGCGPLICYFCDGAYVAPVDPKIIADPSGLGLTRGF